MKKVSPLFFVALFCVLTFSSYSQNKSSMFYATMDTHDAIKLKENHPNDVRILKSVNDYSAVMLNETSAEELHHTGLRHGPGYFYETSKASAINAINQIVAIDKAKRESPARQFGNFSITENAKVRQSLDLVNNLNIDRQIRELEGYGTRFHNTNSARRAATDLKSRWESLAGNRSDVSVRLVNHSGTPMPSVVMTITGTETPNEYVMLGGHLDSTSRQGNNDAPGADDNASGISTITEVARVLFSMDYKPKRTIEFMAFAAEEVGLVGSKEIARDYKNRNVNIISFMQLDMTNYKGSTNDVFITTDSYNSTSLNNFVIELMDFYNNSGTHRITYGTSRCNYGCSDHHSFAQQGYETTFPIEAKFNEANPNIHTARDTSSRFPTANATHAAKFAKLALEYLIEVTKSDTGGGNDDDDECTTTVGSFPYNQSFEGTIGAWSQSTTDDLNWTVDVNGTPSNGTGPSNAVDGNSYLYVEASGDGQGFPNKRAILNSPCLDFSSLSSPTLKFQYHMQGSAIGNFKIEARTDGNGSWSSVFNKTGEQGSDWNQASIDLSAYARESSVELRLNTVTGNSWQGDVTVDGLSITNGGGDDNPPSDDCDTIDFNSVQITSFSNQDNSGDFSIAGGGSGLTLRNNTWKQIPFDYVITENTVIEFDFSSTSQGEIHGVGFEDDNTLTSNYYFKVHGTQNYGVTNFDNYSNGTKRYTIPVGNFYSGDTDRLVFINDNDSGSGNNSTFSNVKIYESSCDGSLTAQEAIAQLMNRNSLIGAEDEGVLSSIKMTPNPTNDRFVLNVNSLNSNEITATIYSILGQKKYQIKLSEGVNEISAKRLALNSGLYIVKIEAEGEQPEVKKLIIK